MFHCDFSSGYAINSNLSGVTSAMPELSIIIPTYNRNVVLRENLSRLIPQVSSTCRIIIIDNHSSVSVGETLLDLVGSCTNCEITILRNRCNIGGNANIARCFELCESEWVWILGDDDCPNDDAIQNALLAIRMAPGDCIYQNFSTKGHYLRRTTYDSAPGLENFLEEMDNFGNCMMISSSLFRVGAMSREIQYGFGYTSTTVPHLLIAMLAIRRLRGTARFHHASLVTHGDAESGGRHNIILGHLGFGLLLSLPFFGDRERSLLRTRIALLLSAKALVAQMAFCRIYGDLTFRGARSIISRCAAESHYSLGDRMFLVLCRCVSVLTFSMLGSRIIVFAVNRLQKGKTVRVQHVSNKEV